MDLYREVERILRDGMPVAWQGELTSVEARQLTRLVPEFGAAEIEVILLALATAVVLHNAVHACQGAARSLLARWETAAFQAETRYAALKFLVFQMMQNNQVLRLRYAGLRAGAQFAHLTTSALQSQYAEQKGDQGGAADDVEAPPLPWIPPALGDAGSVYPDGGILEDRKHGASRYTLWLSPHLAHALKAVLVEEPHPLQLGLAWLAASHDQLRAWSVIQNWLPSCGQQEDGSTAPEQLEHLRAVLERLVAAESGSLVLECRLVMLYQYACRLEELVRRLEQERHAWQQWAASMRQRIAAGHTRSVLRAGQRLEQARPRSWWRYWCRKGD